MNLSDVIGELLWRTAVVGRAKSEVESIKQQEGVGNVDLDVYCEEALYYPQFESVEAKNQDHIRMYDEDIKTIIALREEMNEEAEKEISEYVSMRALGTEQIMGFQAEDVYTIWSAKKHKEGIPEKLRNAAPFLCEGNSKMRMAVLENTIWDEMKNLQEESEKNVKIVQKGKTGEDYVSSILNQYKDKYHVLENVVIPYEDEMGKTSETDVYIICNKGIIVCEAKNYGKEGQTILVTTDDRWEIYSENNYLLNKKPSPVVQNARHVRATEKLMREALESNVPIIPIVVIANDEVGIQNNSKNVVVKASQIADYVETLPDVVDRTTQEKIIQTLTENQMDARDFEVKLMANKARYVRSMQKEIIPYMKANYKIMELIDKYIKQSRISHKLICALLFVITYLFYSKIGDVSVGICAELALIPTLFANNTLIALLGLVCLVMFVLFASGAGVLFLIPVAGAIIALINIGKEKLI